MYDANLVFSESFDIEGVVAPTLLSGVIDLGETRDFTGLQDVFLEIEVLEKPDTSSTFAAYNFALVAATDTSGSSGLILASSPVFGSLVHNSGVQPEVGAKFLIPIATVLSSFATTDNVNVAAYGRRYLMVWYTNIAYSYTLAYTLPPSSGSGGTLQGIMTAGKFRVSLRQGNPSGGRVYPKGYQY
jgi:hypothetical protein